MIGGHAVFDVPCLCMFQVQVASWPRENASDVRLPRDVCNVFRDFCSRSMYQVGAGAGGMCSWTVRP